MGGLSFPPSIFTSANRGLVPASGGGTSNFLRADGSFAAPGGGGGEFHGALVTKSVDQVGANYTTASAIAWDTDVGGYDTDGFHDNLINNTRFTIPSGFTKAMFFTAIRIANAAALSGVGLVFRKNGSADYVGSPGLSGNIEVFAGSSTTVFLSSSFLDVIETDYFEVSLQIGTDNSVDIIAGRSFFAMQALV